MIGTWYALVIDCEDIETSAEFYEELTGMTRIVDETDEDWIAMRSGDGIRLSFHPFCLVTG